MMVVARGLRCPPFTWGTASRRLVQSSAQPTQQRAGKRAVGKPRRPAAPNADIATALKYIAHTTAGPFRAGWLLQAAQIVAAHPTPLAPGEARFIPGVGSSAAEKIDQILSAELKVNLKDARALDLLLRVSGIGPAAALKFVEAGVTTLKQLAEQPLNHHQRIGLKYLSDFEAPIPRTEMQRLEAFVQRAVSGISSKIIVQACGSYRRGASSSGDIDFLLAHPDFTGPAQGKDEGKDPALSLLPRVTDMLHGCGFLTDDLAKGPTKYMGVCKLPKDEWDVAPKKTFHRRIDIRYFPMESFHTALLSFTGNTALMRLMRQRAIDRNLHLSEYGICPVHAKGDRGEPLRVTSERDVFELLDMDFLEPHERNI